MPSEHEIENIEHDPTAQAKKVRIVDESGDPSGLATSANQATANASLASILAKLSADPATQTTLAAILAKLISAPATEAKQDTGNTSLASIKTNTDKLLGFSIPAYDYISQTQNSTQDIWTFKSGGSGGTTVAIITITYSDSTKVTISNIAKT